ncbi:MAG TPA: C45 family autoproteolytic acyltransferase/hydrolase, partial [Thermodesulfobacteriota bacterium]|nr:C45 family autoproteolytic acyltransferase/hydrolase [Thermodesulfobacteriota bacterium]
AELEGIARGAGCPLPALLAYNAYRGLVFPDECTTMIALADATAAGKVLFLKNSDKIGAASLTGPGYYQHKEINVLLVLAPEGGRKVVGVAAAGTTGLKMGINDRGVAVGTNIARTEELAERRVDVTQLRAVDRAQLAREAMEEPTAMAAAQRIAAKVLAEPMATPGNMEFVDAREAVILEGSYTRQALEVVRQGTVSRTNSFVLLKELNQWDDVSSQARLVRTRQLFRAHAGRLTFERFIEFSMDHENGPGPNSICRHGTHYTEETSMAAMVAEIDGDDPLRSRVAVALGKPCHAWRHPEGHLVVRLDVRPEALPAGFLTGETWKRFWTEEPARPAAAASAG